MEYEVVRVPMHPAVVAAERRARSRANIEVARIEDRDERMLVLDLHHRLDRDFERRMLYGEEPTPVEGWAILAHPGPRP